MDTTFNLADIRLIHPVDGPVTQRFGERPDWDPDYYAQWGYPGHNGQDYGVPSGKLVKVSADGVIERIGFEDGGYGNYVKVRHANGGFYTLYAHLQSAMTKVGSKVSQGDVIALSDNTGASTGPHLHFELRVPGNSIYGYRSGARNPEPFFVAEGAPVTTPGSGSDDGAAKTVVVNVAGANVRIAPMGTVVGVAQYGTRFKIAWPAEGEWQPVVCYIHKTLISDV